MPREQRKWSNIKSSIKITVGRKKNERNNTFSLGMKIKIDMKDAAATCIFKDGEKLRAKTGYSLCPRW